jgi:hypothetical protein
VSDPFVYSPSPGEDDAAIRPGAAAPLDEERPPTCPACNRRLVILATHWHRDEAGRNARRQLWGCPRGHATAHRTGGIFSPIELLPDVSAG